MKKRLKVKIPAITLLFILISSVTVCAEGGSSDSLAFSVPVVNGFSYDIPEEANVDKSFYEELEKAFIEKNERYEAFKRTRAGYPDSINLAVTWQQQKNSYYCGPATATMILNHTGYIHATQDILAGPDYLRTTTDGTPWYSGTTQTAPYYFNMVHGLNTYHANNHNIYVNGCSYFVCNSGDTDEYIDKMMFTLSDYHAVPLFGQNLKGNLKSDLRYYVNSGHWLVLAGYTQSGAYFNVVDPASGIEGFEKVSQTYRVPQSEILEFAFRGIIW